MISRLMGAFARRMSRDHPKAYYVKFDVENIREIRQSLRIRSTPSFIIFKDGVRVGEIVGFNPRGLEMAICAALIGIETPSSNFLVPKYPPVKTPANLKVAISNY
ncbi:putative cop c 2-like protein [Erysiphe neolycopersici]|uniref:Putative cop c 2-like protein n=1 Tax=Erysiphe neolycopersici TaxID=212602 RepID=A0A420HSL1_9PEZI|nr:putative cop c 2-like protein [Erysiphe neolycopersici]